MRAYLDEAIPDRIDLPATTWQVIRAVTGKEQQVATALSEIGIATFCPMLLFVIHQRGRLHKKVKALFQNYLFAKWEPSNPHRWHEIMDTQHVLGIIGHDEPQAVDPEIIESWIARTGTGDILADPDLLKTMQDLQRGYRVGDYVRCEGAYLGHNLLVVSIDEETQTVKLQIGLLGRTFVIERLIKECELAGDPPLLDAPATQNRGGARRSRRGGRQAFLVRSFRRKRRHRQ